MRPISHRLVRSSIFRAALVYIGLFGAAVLVPTGVIYWAAVGSLTRQIDATVEAEITGLAEQFNQRGVLGLIRAIQRRSARAGEGRGLYLLTDANYAPLAGNLSRWPDAAPDEAGWITFPLDHAEGEGGGINLGRARAFDLGSWYHLLVGHDVRERLFVAAQIRESLAWGVASAIALFLVGGVMMSRKLLGRMDAINLTSREIMAGDLGRRVPVSGRGDEFDQLAGNLNAMLDQIERLIAGIKQVSDNIAHDLRSPLARLRSRLEVTLMESPDPSAYREAIERTIAEADGLLKTFNALLSIAQAEAGAPRRHFEAVDLGALLSDVAELYEPLAEARGQTLTATAPDSVGVRGDRDLLFQAVANLTDNAVKFAPEGGQIGLALDGAAGEARITVTDNGPGIPEAAREQVLERFFRLEASRSTPGSGLGLSLVAAVARLHHGSLGLEDNAPGLRVQLALPHRPSAQP